MPASSTVTRTTGWPPPAQSLAWWLKESRWRTSPPLPRPCRTFPGSGPTWLPRAAEPGRNPVLLRRVRAVARRTDTWDESDVRIRPNKKGSRPRTKDRPSHDDAVTGRIVTVDRGRYTAVVGEDS